jgi:Phage terminase, small subunit
VTDKTPPKPPEGLRSAGKSLWKAILADLGQGWRLDARELHFLERSCRIEDELRELERVIDADGLTTAGSRGQTTIHPALAEARQLRLVQQRLLGSIELCDPAQGTRKASTLHASQAARARWQRAS